MTHEQDRLHNRRGHKLAASSSRSSASAWASSFLDVGLVNLGRRFVRVVALVQQLRVGLAELIERNALVIGDGLELVQAQFVTVAAGQSRDCRIGTPLPSLGYHALHEGQSVAGQLIFALVHAATDLGGRHEFRQRQAKRLNHQPAIIVDFLQRIEGLFPPYVPFARAYCGRFPRCARGVRTSAQVRIASTVSFSSMCEWNVSYMARQFGWATSLMKRVRSA